ncbi:MAG: hypothetical protein AAF360_05500 [Pseudomonadota bacterium]
MTMQEAIALQPTWVGIWLNVLLLGAFILPISLLIWKQTRLAGLIIPVVSVASALATGQLYEMVGYVKLLGLPHIIFWTPLMFYLVSLWRKDDLPKAPKAILSASMATIVISLAFDYVDLLRYVLGERTPLEGTI